MTPAREQGLPNTIVGGHITERAKRERRQEEVKESTAEETWAWLIEAHFPGFRVGTEDTNLNEEGAIGIANDRKTLWEEREVRKLAIVH